MQAGRSLAETPEGAALGFGDVAMPAASSSDGGGSSVIGSTSSSEDDDSEDDAALVSRMREVSRLSPITWRAFKLLQCSLWYHDMVANWFCQPLLSHDSASFRVRCQACRVDGWSSFVCQQVEGRAAEAGLSAKAAKRARLQAAADRRKARAPPPQPAELDPIARRQVILNLSMDARVLICL